MAEISTIPFKSWHLKLFKHGEHYQTSSLDPDTRSHLYRHVNGATILIDGEIAGIMGIAPLWPGVGEVTMIPSELFYKNIKSCVKLLRESLSVGCEAYGLHRIQATTLESCPKHGRFLAFLGFELEGKLRGYGTAGENYLMYSYVKAGQ